MELLFFIVEEFDEISCEKGCKFFVGSNVDFLKGVVVMNGFLVDDWIEVCFVGCFNVGKFSLINVLMGCKGFVCVFNMSGCM